MIRPHDSQSASTTEPEPATGPDGVPSVEVVGDLEPAPAAGASSRAWALTLAIAMAAGLVSWACGEMLQVPELASGRRGGGARVLPEVPATRNAMVAFGILGATLGLGLGAAGGLIRRSILRGILAAIVGVVLGGAAGAGVSWLTIPVYYSHLKTNDLAYSLLVHGGTWAAIGAVAGLAFGIGRGGWGLMIRCLMGAVAAAMIGTIIYELAGMLIFPTAMTDRPLSKTPETRLLAQLLVAAMVAAGALLNGAGTGDVRRPGGKETAAENPVEG